MFFSKRIIACSILRKIGIENFRTVPIIAGACLFGKMGANNINKNSNGAYAWRFFADYPNDLIDNFVGLSSVQENYNPELGFMSRKNFDNLSWLFRFTPRWFSRLGIRKMYFRPWGFDLYRTHTTGNVESFLNETRPLGCLGRFLYRQNKNTGSINGDQCQQAFKPENRLSTML